MRPTRTPRTATAATARRRPRTVLAAALTALATAAGWTAIAGPAGADTVICEKFGFTTIQSGRYVVQNNVWGDDTLQCINVTATGFSVTTASHNKPTNGGPGSYPSVFAGCHWGTCTAGSSLPMRASDGAFPGVRTSVQYTYPSPTTNVYNASYDMWFDPTPRTDGQVTGAELMVWLNRVGSVGPVGSRVGTVTLAGGTFDVYFGNIGWNVVSYVRTSTASSIEFAVDTFYSDAVSRGYAQRSWYLTSVQAGFEPWVGGVGLAVNSFSYSVGATGGDTTPPSTPTGLTASGTTSTSTALSWTAATDNVGVTGYDVLRSVSGGPLTQIGTATGTSFTATGLTAATTYGFAVRARDAAGNVSGTSSAITVTTPSGGGGAPCRVRYVPNVWSGGFTADITITNTGTTTINGWRLEFAFGGDQRITPGQVWNATVTQSGTAVTATNVSYNATIAPATATSMGFQGTWTSNSTSPSAFRLNGTPCSIG